MNSDIQDVDEMHNNLPGKTSQNGGIRKRLTSSTSSNHDKIPQDKNDKPFTRITDEQKKLGSVGIGIYFRYFKAGGSYVIIFLLIVGFLVTQVLFNFTDYWLSQWTNKVKGEEVASKIGNDTEILDKNSSSIIVKSAELSGEKDQNFYAYVYCGLMGAFIVFSVVRSILFFGYCMRISINLHNGMFRSLVRAPVKFFDDNPSGRIMNRFTKDLSQIDESLPIAFYDFVSVVLLLFGMLALNIAANYYIAVPSVILLVSLWKLREFYLDTARDLKRIESLG